MEIEPYVRCTLLNDKWERSWSHEECQLISGYLNAHRKFSNLVSLAKQQLSFDRSYYIALSYKRFDEFKRDSGQGQTSGNLPGW
jgi:hypothetical protein